MMHFSSPHTHPGLPDVFPMILHAESQQFLITFLANLSFCALESLVGKLWRVTILQTTCTNISLRGSLVPRTQPQGRQCWMCIHLGEPFPGTARLAPWVSHPNLGVAGQRQTMAGTLCASMAGARLQLDSDILGRLRGEARPKARLLIKRQKPEPSSPQLLSSVRLRHADIPVASPQELPAHAITQPLRSALKNPRASLQGSGPRGVEGASPFYQS